MLQAKAFKLCTLAFSTSHSEPFKWAGKRISTWNAWILEFWNRALQFSNIMSIILVHNNRKAILFWKTYSRCCPCFHHPAASQIFYVEIRTGGRPSWTAFSYTAVLVIKCWTNKFTFQKHLVRQRHSLCCSKWNHSFNRDESIPSQFFLEFYNNHSLYFPSSWARLQKR